MIKMYQTGEMEFQEELSDLDVHCLLRPVWSNLLRFFMVKFNPFALRMTKTPWSFGHFECSRVNLLILKPGNLIII